MARLNGTLEARRDAAQFARQSRQTQKHGALPAGARANRTSAAHQHAAGLGGPELNKPKLKENDQ